MASPIPGDAIFHFISKQFVSSTIFLICEKFVNVHFPMKERQKANYAG